MVAAQTVWLDERTANVAAMEAHVRELADEERTSRAAAERKVTVRERRRHREVAMGELNP